MNDTTYSEIPEAYGDFASSTDAANTTDAPTPGEAFAAMVIENPLPAALAAAAVGAGLMALATLMVPSRPSVSKVKVDKVVDSVADEAGSLRSQLGDLAKSVLAALPTKSQLKSRAGDAADEAQSLAQSARDSLSDSLKSVGGALRSAGDTANSSFKSASDTLRSVLGETWDQASDVLQKYQPQVDAATKLARNNPLWAAVLAGVAGTLIGWQLLGASKKD